MAKQYLHTLVTNILSLTKLESSDIQIQRTPYLVEELLEEFEEGLIRRHKQIMSLKMRMTLHSLISTVN